MSSQYRDRQVTSSFLNTYLRSINAGDSADELKKCQSPLVTEARCPFCHTTFSSDELLALHDCAVTNKRPAAAAMATGVTSSKGPCLSPSQQPHQIGSSQCLTALTMDGKTVIIDSRSITMVSPSHVTHSDCQLSSATDAMDVADTLSCSDFADMCDTASLDDLTDKKLPADNDDRMTDDTLSAIGEEALESLDDSFDWTELLDSQFSSDCFSSIISDLPITPDVDFLSTQKDVEGFKWKSPPYNKDTSSVTLTKTESVPSLSPMSQATSVDMVSKRMGDVFVCTVCHQVFPSDKYLAMHTPIHSVEHPTEDFLSDEFREQQSGITTSVTSGSLKVKVTGGSGRNAANWSCKICNKIFAQNSNFKNHMRTHSDERPYVCNVCNIGFKERYHLKKHQLFKHSSELKEKCRVCGKLFKDSTAVRAHERIHSDIRPYSCKRCGKTFKTSECLWHHENRSKTCNTTDIDSVAAAALAAQTARARKTRVSSAKPASPPPTLMEANTATDRRRAMTFSGLPVGKESHTDDEMNTAARKPTVSLVFTPTTWVAQSSKATGPRIAVIQPLARKVAAVSETTSKPPVKILPLIAVPKVKVEQSINAASTLVTPHSINSLSRSWNGFELTKVKSEQTTTTSSDIILCHLPEVEVNTTQSRTLTRSQTASPSGGRYACDTCGKQFMTATGRDRHSHTHKDSRPFHCSSCDVSFKLKVHLKKHNLYRHSDEKPCACNICGKAFKDISAVRLHEKTHSSHRPFVCDCGKSFKTRENLWGHCHRGPCDKLVMSSGSYSYSETSNSCSSVDSV